MSRAGQGQHQHRSASSEGVKTPKPIEGWWDLLSNKPASRGVQPTMAATCRTKGSVQKDANIRIHTRVCNVPLRGCTTQPTSRMQGYLASEQGPPTASEQQRVARMARKSHAVLLRHEGTCARGEGIAANMHNSPAQHNAGNQKGYAPYMTPHCT